MRTVVIIFIVITILGASAGRAAAQERLTLQDAISRALETSPAIQAAQQAQRAAEAGVDEARGAWLPRVDYVGSWQRSNQPVFVFGSLLAQSRFGAANFAIDALNHPDAVSNLRNAVTIEQSLFDPARRARTRIAAVARDASAVSSTALARDVALAVTRAYGRILVAAAGRRAAQAALDAAAEDRTRAAHRRDAGVATDADVLAFDVQAAAMKARLAQSTADETIARATLNDLVGAPFESTFALDELTPVPPGARGLDATLESEALSRREQVRHALLQEQAAAANRSMARASFLPHAGLSAGYEIDSRGWSGGGGWWMAGVQVRWNLFNGLSDRARVTAADAAIARAKAERARVENAIRLEVRSAAAQLDAARVREEAGRTAAAQAREAQRIIRERYEAGLAGVTDVLRAANALLDAELQQRAATVDVYVSDKTLEWVLGR